MTWFIEHLHRDGSVLARQIITGNEFRIGRALDNDLVTDDAHCAAYHALVSIDAGGSASLQDLSTHNGIAPVRGKRAAVYVVLNDELYRLGQTTIRLRNSAWPIPAELPLFARTVWPFAMAALGIVLLHLAWNIWLGDVNEKTPPYLYGLFGAAAGLGLWSGFYALLGRLISGAERFFTHLLIACTGYLLITLVSYSLQLLSFSMAWLWPMRIELTVTIILLALLVRAHLRVADPRHWPTLRWAVSLVAISAIVVPVAQLWISSQRLTNVQTLKSIEYPVLRLAKPVSVDSMTVAVNDLKVRIDIARTKEDKTDGSGIDDAD